MTDRILEFTKTGGVGKYRLDVLYNARVLGYQTKGVWLCFLLADPLCLLESCYSRCSVLLQRAPKQLEAS